jgi:hypothetical protein
MASMFGFEFASIKAGQASQEAYVNDGVQKCHYHEIGQANLVLNDEDMKDPHCYCGLSRLTKLPQPGWKEEASHF